jgi:hypothetical protein
MPNALCVWRRDIATNAEGRFSFSAGEKAGMRANIHHFSLCLFNLNSMFLLMPDPKDDDTPPPEELEMAVEEQVGHAMPGIPAERIDALTKRIEYINQQIVIAAGMTNRQDDELKRLNNELAAAKQQLEHWKIQHEGRN